MAGIIKAAGAYTLTADLRCPPFQALARAITHQQLNGTAAKTILARFVALVGVHGKFPTPDAVLAMPDADLRAAGLSFAKIAALKDLAAKTLDGTVSTRRQIAKLGDEEIIERLTSVRGVGRWTVEMMLMFQLGRTDVLPVDDFGVRHGFMRAYGLKSAPHPKVLAKFGERWKPYRTAAAWYLWRATDLHREGTLPAAPMQTRLPRLRRKTKRKQARAPAVR